MVTGDSRTVKIIPTHCKNSITNPRLSSLLVQRKRSFLILGDSFPFKIGKRIVVELADGVVHDGRFS